MKKQKRPPIAVEGPPQQDLPEALVCGECGGSSGEVLWQGVEVDGERGAVGFANCTRCGCSVSGILAQDPAVMAVLRRMVEETFR